MFRITDSVFRKDVRAFRSACKDDPSAVGLSLTMSFFDATRSWALNTRNTLAATERDVVSCMTSDESLIARLKEGDREALSALFNRHAGLVRGICRRILRDEAEAEDLTQDIFLFIQRKCSVFDSSRSSAISWIVQTTYKRAIDRRRYLNTRHFYNRENIDEREQHIGGQSLIEDDYCPEVVFGRNGFEKVLASLSQSQRETLRLYFFEGYTLAEISARLNQPLGNVRHHYYRGLDKLREQMFGTKIKRG